MNEHEYQKHKIKDWKIEVCSDSDGHLNLYVQHKDQSEVIICNADITDNETMWADRFTTEKIEQEYEKGDRK
jgi:alpha-N-acetylglucosamine transferase